MSVEYFFLAWTVGAVISVPLAFMVARRWAGWACKDYCPMNRLIIFHSTVMLLSIYSFLFIAVVVVHEIYRWYHRLHLVGYGKTKIPVYTSRDPMEPLPQGLFISFNKLYHSDACFLHLSGTPATLTINGHMDDPVPATPQVTINYVLDQLNVHGGSRIYILNANSPKLFFKRIEYEIARRYTLAKEIGSTPV